MHERENDRHRDGIPAEGLDSRSNVHSTGPESEAMLDTTAQESMWVFRGETLWPGIEADKITTLCLMGFVEQSRQVGSRLHVELY
ncbi:MAG: hypothetical protein IH868_02090 [Chloroflexi bacterium]|nr:hypothetical protein [Chloroflexota bacterium]